jgi:SSS family transporter
MTPTFTLIDLAVVLVYLAGTTALGIWVGRRQKDAKDYFVASRAIPWWAVLFSVVATETSAITFISVPGVAFKGNLGYLQLAAGYILGRAVIAVTLLPRYYRGELVTAYALLERRFGLATRRFTSIVFMVTRAMADSVRVFATAIPLALILGPSMTHDYQDYVMPVAILILGVLTVVYTYRGGMKAVVWTEIVQASIYLTGGIAAVVILGQLVPGGWGTILREGKTAGKLHAINPTTVLSEPYGLWAGLFGGAFLSMGSHGVDQLIVQRLLCSRSLGDARKALVGSGLVVFLQFALFLLVGVGLYAFYQGSGFRVQDSGGGNAARFSDSSDPEPRILNSESAPPPPATRHPSPRTFARPDDVFPTFILEQMPHGLVGLLVAAIIAATMSTHSAAINSLAAAATHDIYLPLMGRRADDSRTLRAAKLFSLAWGVALTLGALLFRQRDTPVVEVALGIASFTYGALLGGFFLGIFWPRARQWDAILGMSVGIFVMAIIAVASQLSKMSPAWAERLGPLAAIAWPWYALIGTEITMLSGVVSSLVRKGKPLAA